MAEVDVTATGDEIEIEVFDYPEEIDVLNQRVLVLEQNSNEALTEDEANILYAPINHTHTASEVGAEAEGTAAGLINDLKDEVPEPGNTLYKLYNLILNVFSEVTVADITARNAYDAPLGCHVFVLDDSDGKWALYKATTAGVNANYVKLSDPDLLNALMTASAIKTAYESNADTNAFTNALLSKLNGIPADAQSSTTVFNDQEDDYLLQASDINKHIRMKKSTASTLTINDVFAVGQSCTMEQWNTGQVTFVAGANVTLKSADNMVKTRVQESGVTIVKEPETGIYKIFGDLTA